MTVLDTLEETGLMDNTIILRFADHGEGGLSHGMREKAYTVYEEMIHVPLIVHNPSFSRSRCETEAFYDHLDLLPTLLDLAGVANPESVRSGQEHRAGDEGPIDEPCRDHTIFSFDDLFFFFPAECPGPEPHPSDSRRRLDLRGLFWDGRRRAEYELYNIKSDPANSTTCSWRADRRREKEWARLHRILTPRLIETGNLPDTFTWPLEPVRA